MRATAAFILLLSLAGTAHAQDAAPASRAAFGVLDFIFIGFAVYVVWRMITNASRNKRDGQGPKTYDVPPENDRAPSGQEGQDGWDSRARRAQAAWEALTGERAPDAQVQDEHEKDLPGTFNEREFLRGAKMIYGRIRQSWAARDLADLRQFAAPDMMARFEAWAGERPEREQIAVLLVEARVLDLKRDGKRTEVTVGYDATISDDPAVKESRKIGEVWLFSRDETVAEANWLLESMEKAQ